MHSSGCFLGNTSPFFDDLMPAKWIFALNLEQQILYDLLFSVGRFSFRSITAFLQFAPFMDEQSRIAAIIDHKLGAFAVWMRKRAVGSPPIIFQ